MTENPYESPENVDLPEPSLSRRGGKRVVPFASARLRAYSTIALLALNLILATLLMLASLLQAALLARAMAGHKITPEEAFANDSRIQILVAVRLIAYAVCAIMFVAWMHRAHRNLSALGAERLEFTPGWAIGAWFVPFLNLVRPYQIVREIWLASNPKFVGDKNWRWRNGPTGPLLGLWWAGWLAMCILGVVSQQFFTLAKELESLRDASYFQAMLQLITIVAAILAIGVVRIIDQRQSLAYDTLCEIGSDS